MFISVLLGAWFATVLEKIDTIRSRNRNKKVKIDKFTSYIQKTDKKQILYGIYDAGQQQLTIYIPNEMIDGDMPETVYVESREMNGRKILKEINLDIDLFA